MEHRVAGETVYWNIYEAPYFSVICHEARHCYQWRVKGKVKFIGSYLSGLLQSWVHGKAYDHKYFKHEQGAIAFQRFVDHEFSSVISEEDIAKLKRWQTEKEN